MPLFGRRYLAAFRGSFALARVLASALTFSSCAPTRFHPPPPPGNASVAKLEAYVLKAISDSDPPSLSISVSQRSRVAYERAFGYADGPGGVLATPESTYRWFSVTKPFTAVAILQLAEQGAVSLTAPAATYLPWLSEFYGANTAQITIERLLSHQAGIGDIGNSIMSWVHVVGHHDQSELLRKRLPKHVQFDADALNRGHYSNLGYMILGGVIEAVSNESYEAFITNHILNPLGMQRSHFYYEDPFPVGTVHAVGSHPDDIMAFMASFSLDLSALTRECVRHRHWFRHFSPDQTPPSGLISTSSDMARFGRMIAADGELDGHRLLSKTSIERMTQARVPITTSPAGDLPGFSFGEGWFITKDAKGRRVLMHGGQGMAFISLLMIRPEDEFVAAIVANGTYIDGASGLDLMKLIAEVDWTSER